MTLQEAKDNLLKEVETPKGKMILYGINLIPKHNGFGLIFYNEFGELIRFWNEHCFIIIN